MTELEFLRQQLADKMAGIPSHTHRDTDGDQWLCTSPYCDRGGDVRNDPQPGPQETKEFADIRYRRGNA